jgi:hypothetical protein
MPSHDTSDDLAFNAKIGKQRMLSSIEDTIAYLQRERDKLIKELSEPEIAGILPKRQSVRKVLDLLNSKGKPLSPKRGGESWAGLTAQQRKDEMRRRKRLAQSRNKARASKAAHDYWDGLSKEERSDEMKRRAAVAKKNKARAAMHSVSLERAS